MLKAEHLVILLASVTSRTQDYQRLTEQQRGRTETEAYCYSLTTKTTEPRLSPFIKTATLFELLFFTFLTNKK